MADVDDTLNESVEETPMPDADSEVTATYDDESDAAQMQDDAQDEESEPAMMEEGMQELQELSL